VVRIALITQRFPPLCCGVGDYTLGLARALGEQGHEVIVITRPEQGLRPAGIRVAEAPLDGWGDLRSVLRLLERERVEYVQLEYSGYGWSRWGFSFWLNALVLVLRQRGIPVHLGLHETYIRFVDHPHLAAISLLQRIHIWLLISSASGVYLNMRERVLTHRRWLPWCRGRIHYRPNSSTIPVVPLPEQKRCELRAALHVEPDDCVVATFGLFQKDKNFEALIDAMAKARTARPLRLWLLGDSRSAEPAYMASLRERVRALGIEQKVFWSGRLAPEQVSAHLQAAEVFVLPQPDGHLTRSSAFMAAAAHGMPVIAVRNPENQGEFENGNNLLLAEKSSATEIAAKLESLAGDSALRANLGMNLRQTYHDQFDWPVTARMGTEKVPAFAASIDAAGSAEPARKI
jgi:glycosyltransferase involved in cell wall biosynthesis